MAPGERSPRIHPLVPAVVAVVIVGVLVLVVAGSGGEDDAAPTTSAPPATTATTTTTTTTTAPAPVPVAPLLADPPPVDAPSAYRITYDVVENGLPRVEEWTVRRPYESLVLSTRDGVLLTGTATSRARLQMFVSEERGWLAIQPELHRAAFDQHPAAPLAAMEALGLVERRGEGEHLGRRCTVYRTGQPTSAGAAVAASDGEHTDLCVDDAGLVLHERWDIGGSTVIERTVTDLDLDPAIDDALFEPGPAAEGADGLARAFTTIAVQADEETLARLDTVVPLPGGYVDDGAVFRAAGGSGPGGATPSAAEIVRFYSSGPALLEVSEVFIDGDAELGGDPAVPVEVDGWDEVWFEPGFRSSSLRARLGTSSYVELRHHDVGFLFEVLESLVRDGA